MAQAAKSTPGLVGYIARCYDEIPAKADVRQECMTAAACPPPVAPVLVLQLVLLLLLVLLVVSLRGVEIAPPVLPPSRRGRS